MDLKKAGSKKQTHCYSKREEETWSLLFLNNNDPIFFTLLFSGPYFGPDFFQCHKPTHVVKTRIFSACRLTGRLSWYSRSFIFNFQSLETPIGQNLGKLWSSRCSNRLFESYKISHWTRWESLYGWKKKMSTVLPKIIVATTILFWSWNM